MGVMTTPRRSVLPEERYANALRRVSELATQHAQLMEQASNLADQLREAAVEAVREKAPIVRTAELAGVTRETIRRWATAAGVNPRKKQTP